MGNDSTDIYTSFLDFVDRVRAATSRLWNFFVEPITVHVIEMEDVLFHLDSAVMMPDKPAGKSSTQGVGDNPEDTDIKKKQEQASGLRALALGLKQFEFDPRLRLLIAGHTDTSGAADMNFKLSDLRARGVQFLLTGARDDWAKISTERHKIEDYQQIMEYVANNSPWKWPCHPGKIDNIWGPKTSGATEKFIASYNAWIASGQAPKKSEAILPDVINQIKVPDHKWPLVMWLAVYDIYNDDLAAALGADRDELVAYRSRLQFVNADKKYIACGKSFPIDSAEKDNYRSQLNRRVELLFFDREMKSIDCPARTSSIHTEEECPIWHKLLLNRKYPNPLDLTSVAYHLRFIYFDRITNKWLDLPDGLTIKAYENQTVEIKNTRIEHSGGIYVVKVPDKPKTERKDIHFTFEANDSWLYKADADTDPVVVVKTREQLKNEIDAIVGKMIADGSAKVEETPALVFKERLKYYDLPKLWSSWNYWTRSDTKSIAGKRYQKAMEKIKPYGGSTTTPVQALVFSLNDIVLVDKDEKQTITDQDQAGTSAPKNLSKHSRITLLYLDPDDKFKVKIHKPKDKEQFFSDVSFQENLVVDFPITVRAIVFCNDFYDVADKRTTDTGGFSFASDHIIGARAAKIHDSDVSARQSFIGTSATDISNAYLAKDTGNYDLHYLHQCGLNGNKLVSALVLHWSARFILGTATGKVGTETDRTNFKTLGMLNAMNRRNAKDYQLEKLTGNEDIIIKTFAIYEAKLDTKDGTTPVTRGGTHKCIITVGGSGFRSGMNIAKADFEASGYQEQPGLVGSALPISGLDNVPDFDGSKWKWLTVAHELGHASGLDDEYHEPFPKFAPLPQYTQYYPGMPYSIDGLSLMLNNRATRIRHFCGLTNWINAESLAGKKLNNFLHGTQFAIKFSTLNYEIPGTKYKSIYTPTFKATPRTFSTHASHDLYLYKLGDDEFAHAISSGQIYKAILIVNCRISAVFSDATSDKTDAAKVWTQPQQRQWLVALNQDLQTMVNKYRLESTNANNDFANTYICVKPYYEVTTGAATSGTNFTISVTKNSATTFSPSGTTLTVGNNVDNKRIIRYMFGKESGVTDLTKDDLVTLRDWIKDASVANADFAIKNV